MYRTCAQKHYYKYIEKLRPRIKAPALTRGSIIHEMIEAHLQGLDPWKSFKELSKSYGKMFVEEKAAYDEMIEEIRRLMISYFDFYKRDPIKYKPLNGKYSEHYFEVPLTKSIDLIGYLDSFGKTKDGMNWLVEHKTHKQIPKAEQAYRNIQSALYCWIAPQIGLPKPDGVAWNYIRFKAPSIPELLKSGELSRRAADTTWPVYQEAIKAHNLNEKNYLDMKEKLQGKESDFFIRDYLPVNATLINNILLDVKRTALEIKEKGHKNQIKNIDHHCNFCDYKAICNLSLRGQDSSFIKKTDFTTEREDRNVNTSQTPK